jgi:Flp pilus assembly pilin Flp
MTMNRIRLSKRIAGRKSHLGQGMTEYIIIVALVAIGAIGVYSAFGHTVQDQMTAITNGLAGNSAGASTATQTATTEAQTATTDSGQKLGLDTFTKNVKDQ